MLPTPAREDHVTETNAFAIGQSDAAETLRRLQEATSPRDIEAQVARFVTHRVGSIAQGRAHRVTAQVMRAPVQMGSVSERLAERTCQLIRRISQLLDPEDCYAALSWLVGTREQGAGFIQHVLLGHADAHSNEAIRRIEADVTTVRQRLETRDKVIFSSVLPGLSAAKQRIVRGLMFEAQRSATDGDGERARTKVVAARRLVIRFSQSVFAPPPRQGAPH